ncbi:hypothetical protein QFW96_29485 [Saccharopolyspora sp. TS4A08]|uniref:Uncharacterized protein n=1 Tax=Saccharopolyspora ipomoeae TaxID=3042027 RepID=A0ABT6PZF6_9PSEU|nr:hypothetical protein [Saccharopolyspora sp. TS4A08]MDI2032786.1 hypothetical protein [Saccharopolyspora sp. TS4A08]
MSHTGTSSAPARAAAIAAPRTGERLHVAVETSAGETYLIAFVDSPRDSGCEPCELSPDEARDLARAVLDLLDAEAGQVSFAIPRSDQQLNLAIEADGAETYLITWLGRTTCDAGYEPSELGRTEAVQLARALQDLADAAEGA